MSKTRKIDIEVTENLLDILDAIDCDIKEFIQSFLDRLTSSESGDLENMAKAWAMKYCKEFDEDACGELMETFADICPEFKSK